MDDAYRELANAVVLQAVKDWRDAVHKLKKRPRYEPAKEMKKECEEFFLSDWFVTLTDCDGSTILKKLQEEENI